MKTIYLIRHAKSSWSSPTLSDFERPLNDRGKNDAPKIGKQLSKHNFNAELIIASPSVRTTETITLISKEVGYNFSDVLLKKELYHASLNTFKQLVNNLSNTQNSVALVGHNYGISDFANYLTSNFIGIMPTCATVKIKLEIDLWEEITEGIGKTEFYIYPKNMEI